MDGCLITIEHESDFVIVTLITEFPYTLVTVFGSGEGSPARVVRVSVTVADWPGARLAGKSVVRFPRSVSFTLLRVSGTSPVFVITKVYVVVSPTFSTAGPQFFTSVIAGEVVTGTVAAAVS